MPRAAYAGLLFVVFATLVLSGTTLSSVGTAPLRVDGTDPGKGLIVGTPRSIRSDEFLRTSPWRLGAIEDPDLSFRSPLSDDDGAITTAVAGHGVASRLVFFDSLIIRVGHVAAPTAAFALLWWLPTILFWAFGPALLSMFGLSRALSMVTLGLIYFSPAVVWWSLTPIASGLCYAMAAAVLLAVACDRIGRVERARAGAGAPADRRRDLVVAALCILATGPLVARLPFAYAPWSIVLSATVLLPAAAVMIERHGWRTPLKVGGVAGAWTALLGLGVLIENRESFRVLGATAYPGHRREGGAALDLAHLFGAPHLGILRTATSFVNTNQSEISTSYLVLLAPCLIAAMVLGRRSTRTERTAWWSLAAVIAVLFAWITIDMPPGLARRIPVINLSPPPRVGQVLGLPVAILFGLTLARLRREDEPARRRAAIGAGAATLVLLTLSGSNLRNAYLPDLTIWRVLLVAVAFAFGTALVTYLPHRWWSAVPLLAVAVSATWRVNPIQVGAADLTSGEAAETIARVREAAPDARWASDTIFLDGLMMANAVPMVSGQQWVGPDATNWRLLDPQGTAESMWNRGAAYIHFTWNPALPAAQITNSSPDVIDVAIDPCTPALGTLGLTYVVSTAELSTSCLTKRATFDLGAAVHYVYERAGA